LTRRLGGRATQPTQKIDVFIPTYNSALHLQECLDSARRAYPVRRFVIIDHRSTDGTLEVARRNGCEVVFEEKGLAYARQLSVEMAETEVFAMVESDLIFHEFGWYERALGLLSGKVGAVVAAVPRDSDDARGKYAAFWSAHTPLKGREHGFSAGATLFRREALRGISIPAQLGAYEDRFMAKWMAKRGWGYRWVEVKGIHHSDYESERKARWYGANARLLYELDRDLTLFRRHVTLPAKGAVAAIGTLSPSVFVWSLSFTLNFFNGWRHPERYARFMR
jgi:glycosyltransferase involved in cell wall biosynthesis